MVKYLFFGLSPFNLTKYSNNKLQYFSKDCKYLKEKEQFYPAVNSDHLAYCEVTSDIG